MNIDLAQVAFRRGVFTLSEMATLLRSNLNTLRAQFEREYISLDEGDLQTAPGGVRYVSTARVVQGAIAKALIERAVATSAAYHFAKAFTDQASYEIVLDDKGSEKERLVRGPCELYQRGKTLLIVGRIVQGAPLAEVRSSAVLDTVEKLHDVVSDYHAIISVDVGPILKDIVARAYELKGDTLLREGA